MAGRVAIIGGGLAGSEAAWQLAARGVPVDLFEMRPVEVTPVHQTGDLAELVCSNSLGGNALDQPAGLLKEELRRMGSLVIRIADEVRVPAGSALAVDRALFSRRITEELSGCRHVAIHRSLVRAIPDQPVVIVATGPLTAADLARDIGACVGQQQLYFYDAISPVVDAETIDPALVFRAARYGKGAADYVNCPLNEGEYQAFWQALITAECATLHDFEREHFFEGCLPVEVLARRGPETLAFGPLRPVGLIDPRTGRRPHAVVQLRQDNLAATHYSLVGMQTQLKHGEQRRVFRMIPGLARAEFVRLGMVHRNTYINSPATLDATFEHRRRPGLFFAGQLSGVEGYVESTASGAIAALGAARRVQGRAPVTFPDETALGALGRYVAQSDPRHFQPANMAFGLLPGLPEKVGDRRARRLALAQRALRRLSLFREELAQDGLGLPAGPKAGTGRCS